MYCDCNTNASLWNTGAGAPYPPVLAATATAAVPGSARAGLRPGDRRAIGRPRTRSRSAPKSAAPSGRPVASAALIAAKAGLSASPSMSAANESTRANIGATVTSPSSMPAKTCPGEGRGERQRSTSRQSAARSTRARTDRIHRDVCHCRHQMRVVHRHGCEPAVEQMAAPSTRRIDKVGPAPVRGAERPSQAIFVFGTENEADVVWRQAIAPHSHRGLAHLLGQDVAVDVLIPVFEANIGSRRFPRAVTWWGHSGATIRAKRAMPGS